jgi:hypothetical protein
MGFEPPETFPDFTQCDQTTPEENLAWKAIIRDGGPTRGFSQIMPAFGDALTDEQIDAVIGYLRSLCKDDRWPRGELNLPRALATEKAFPESETVLTSAFNAQHSPGIDSEIAYEHRLGKRSQLEVAVPFSFIHRDSGGLSGGVGDVSYFLGGSLKPEVRRAAEDALVREYHRQLVAAGVDQSWDDCWAGYRRYALGGLMMAILASQVVVRTERGDAMFTVMAEHAGQHALDLDAESFLT